MKFNKMILVFPMIFSSLSMALSPGQSYYHSTQDDGRELELSVLKSNDGSAPVFKVMQIDPPLKQFPVLYKAEVLSSQKLGTRTFESGELHQLSPEARGNSYPIGQLIEFNEPHSMSLKIILTNTQGEEFVFYPRQK